MKKYIEKIAGCLSACYFFILQNKVNTQGQLERCGIQEDEKSVPYPIHIREIIINWKGENNMYVVIAKIKANRNRISKYGLIDPESKKVYFYSPTEVHLLMEKETIIGLHQHGAGSVRTSSYFRDVSVIGQDSKTEAFTVIRQYVDIKEREFELCDGIGITHIVSEGDLRELIQLGVLINGVQLRCNGILAICKGIEVCKKEKVNN